MCLNFSHFESTLRLMQFTYQDFFSLPKTVFELVNFDAFYCFCCFFVSCLLPWQNVSLWGLFSPRGTNKQTNKQKGHSGQAWVNREGGAEGLRHFGHKLLDTQRGVGPCSCKSPIMKWGNASKESSKKLIEAERSLSQHQLAHWYRWVPRTVT